MFEIVRIVAYAIVSVGMFYCAIDDAERRRYRLAFLWLAFALSYFTTIVLLAFDYIAYIEWLETRYLLTPFAIMASAAVIAHVYERYQERKKLREWLRNETTNGNA